PPAPGFPSLSPSCPSDPGSRSSRLPWLAAVPPLSPIPRPRRSPPPRGLVACRSPFLLFRAHAALFGLHHDERHPHTERVRSRIHQRMRFERPHGVYAFVLHGFQSLRLLVV